VGGKIKQKLLPIESSSQLAGLMIVWRLLAFGFQANSISNCHLLAAMMMPLCILIVYEYPMPASLMIGFLQPNFCQLLSWSVHE